MLEVYGDQVKSRRRVFHWHKQFREGHALSMAVKQSVRPVSIFTDEMINTTQRDIAVHFSIAEGTVQKIFKNLLQMTRVCSHCI